MSREDLLDVNALCAGSIAGITTSAAAVAPYGAAVHAACRYNALTKNGAAQASGMQLALSCPQSEFETGCERIPYPCVNEIEVCLPCGGTWRDR